MTITLERVAAVPDVFRDDNSASLHGDAWLRELYTQQWMPMVRLASLMLNSSDLAEEIVQDALVAVHQRREQFDTMGHTVAYLRATVVNKCRSAHRHRGVVTKHADQLLGASPETPAEVVDRQVVNDSVLTALRALPTRQQEVLILRYYSDMSEAEIADTLGISRGAVKSHTHRGVQALRESLASVVKEGR